MHGLEIKSDFAVLDVKDGRRKLESHFRNAPSSGPVPDRFKIPVVIRGFIDGQWGNDDGESIEFSVEVSCVEVGGKP